MFLILSSVFKAPQRYIVTIAGNLVLTTGLKTLISHRKE